MPLVAWIRGVSEGSAVLEASRPRRGGMGVKLMRRTRLMFSTFRSDVD